MLLITSVTNNATNLINNSSDFNELRSSVSSLLCYTTIPSSTIAVSSVPTPPDTTNNTQSGDTVYADRE